jgi:hypothetical protein
VSQDKANLERIRDNQRRSRARRKKYLEDLEARLQNYELQCTRASSEIQAAARRVADENEKLRILLARYGIGDDTVVAYLQSSTSDTLMGRQCTSSNDAVQPREQLLQTCNTSYLDGNISMPAESRTGGLGSLGSTSFGTISFETYPPTKDKHLDTYSRSRTNRQRGPIEPTVHDSLWHHEWNE